MADKKQLNPMLKLVLDIGPLILFFAANAKFVIVGDLNCDPVDGEGMRGTMDQLLKSPRVNASFIPTSEGGPRVVQEHPDQFVKHHGDPTHVTADFTPEHHVIDFNDEIRIDLVDLERGLLAAGARN